MHAILHILGGHTGQHSPGGGGRGCLHGGLMQAILHILGGHTGQHSPGGGGRGFSHGGLMQAMLHILGGHTGQHCLGGGGRGLAHSVLHSWKTHGQNGQHPPGGGGSGSCPGRQFSGAQSTRLHGMDLGVVYGLIAAQKIEENTYIDYTVHVNHTMIN